MHHYWTDLKDYPARDSCVKFSGDFIAGNMNDLKESLMPQVQFRKKYSPCVRPDINTYRIHRNSMACITECFAVSTTRKCNIGNGTRAHITDTSKLHAFVQFRFLFARLMTK